MSVGRGAKLSRSILRIAHPRTTAVLSIVLLAVVVRWPELTTVPRFNDELADVALGFRIARGLELPLTGWSPANGSLFNFLIAAAFLLSDPQVAAGRVVVMLLGALTVVPTYLLGHSLGGSKVGLLAALLMAVSASHTAVNSHISYSHSIMPLFSTTALWLLHRAVVESSGPRLVASGAAFGLALQNHLTVLAIAPGMALYLLWKGRPLIWPWLLLAGLGMLLAVANLLIFNLMTRFSGLSFAATRSGAYVAGETFDLGAWAGRLLLLLRTGGAALGGLVSESAQPEALFHPLVALYAVLALVGFVLLCRRGEWLPLLALVSGLLLISLLNGRLEPLVVRARYSAPLLPLGCVAVAVSLVDLHQQARQTSQRLRIAPTRVADLAGLFLALPLVFGPLFLLHGYYEDAHRRGRTNRPILATLEAISRAGPSGEWVCVDRALNDRRTLPSGRLLEIMEWTLPLRGRQVRVVYIEGDGQSSGLSLEDCGVLVLDPNSLELVASYYELEPLPGEPGRQAPLRAFRFR